MPISRQMATAETLWIAKLVNIEERYLDDLQARLTVDLGALPVSRRFAQRQKRGTLRSE